MKKNNKGFFLAETLIVISLVTLILAFVYPNLSKLYETFVLKTNYYDQVQDIQSLKTIDFAFNEKIEELCEGLDDDNYEQEKKKVVKVISKNFNFYIAIPNESSYSKPKYILKRLYLTKYNTTASFLEPVDTNKDGTSTCEEAGTTGYCDAKNIPGGAYGLNRYLTRIRQTKLADSCRLIGVYEFNNNGVQEYRYASVEHNIITDDGKIEYNE